MKREWDAAAEVRDEQIREGKDLSFHLVLLPTLDRLRRSCNQATVLDVGCGTGYLTHHLAASAESVIGVDVSGASIAIARDRHARGNVTYIESSVEAFGSRWDGERFTLIVANMVLTTTPSLGRFVAAVTRLLAPGGCFVFTIPHPWFWPSYWDYARAPWFDYNREIAIEAPFKISRESTEAITTHFHRPLEMYVHAFASAGLAVIEVEEPLPDESQQAAYPKPWAYPRFLACRLEKQERVQASPRLRGP